MRESWKKREKDEEKLEKIRESWRRWGKYEGKFFIFKIYSEAQ